MDIARWVQSWGLPAVGVGSFLEGESVLLVAGAAAARGHLSIQAVMAVAAVASFIGDQLFFLIGRRYGTALLMRFPALQPRAQRVTVLLECHHLPLILSIRFLYGLRVAGPIAIGMSRVPWSRFLALNFVGAVCWAVLIGGLGYSTGHALAYALQSVDADELWGAGVAGRGDLHHLADCATQPTRAIGWKGCPYRSDTRLSRTRYLEQK